VRTIANILLLCLVVVMGLAMQAGVAAADIFNIQDDVCLEDLGTFTGTLNYVDTDATSATLTVTLTNTSPAANGGYITAFVFNNPGNLITGVNLNTATGLTTLLGGTTFQDLVKASPFPNFDIGATVNGDNNNGFEGGGSPNGGIAVGSTGTFTFSLTGTNLDTLNTDSFVNATVNDNVYGDIFMAVRFRGFEDDGSDKCTTETDGFTPIPLPGTLPLLGTGLLALGIWRWRRR
jgi:hypothetical protein